MRTKRPTTLKRKVMFAAAMGLMAVGAASPALATTEYPEGGTWFYTVSVCCNVSHFDHPDRNHGSSVRNGNGLVRSECKGPGITAKAEQPATFRGNKAFYRFC